MCEECEKKQPPMTLKMSCGHEWVLTGTQAAEWMIYALKALALDSHGPTFDCPTCGNTEVIRPKAWAMETQDLHQYIHSQNPAWPADGKNTSFVEVPIVPVNPDLN